MYLWVKALHVVAVISWMAGMLYLPRLYVYHTGAKPGGEASELLKVMERRLLRYIINPAMVATWILGFFLATLYGWDTLKHAGWFHVKLLMVVVLQICHVMLARWRKDFAADHNKHTAKFYKIVNEVPTVLMIIIVLMVIIKPF